MVDSYTAQDIIIAEDYNGEWVLTDFADNTVAELTAPNNLSTTSTGYNGNSLGAHNEPGRQRELTLRLVKASGDDKRFNENYNLWKNKDFRFKPLTMRFTKNVAHSNGSVTREHGRVLFRVTGRPAGTNNGCCRFYRPGSKCIHVAVW